jgi:hypothetical protein
MLLVQSFILMIYLCYALHSTLFGQLQTLVVVSPLEKKKISIPLNERFKKD